MFWTKLRFNVQDLARCDYVLTIVVGRKAPHILNDSQHLRGEMQQV